MIALAILLIPVLAAGAGVIYQHRGRLRDLKTYPAPGRILESAGTRLHVQSMGSGQPTVVLESGIAASSVNWHNLQDRLAAFAHVIRYDRAGFAWSAGSRSPRTSSQMIEELRGALAAAGAEAPYILVGHSFGALLARLYAARFPKEVAGLVLIDSALIGEWAHPNPHNRARLERGIALSQRGATLCRLGVVRGALTMLASGGRFVPKLVGRASSGQGVSVLERLIGEVRKLPPELWPIVMSHWCRHESFESMGAHLRALPQVAQEVAEIETHGDLPMVVISGAHLKPEGLEEHRQLAAMSSAGKHLIASQGAHWVHLDEPELVVNAIRDVVETVRSRGVV